MRPVAPAEVFSVAELDRRLKRAVEGASADVWVEGEVSGAKPAPSGHVYFTLKDEREDAVLECVMYRSTPPSARKLLVDGARVQLRGRATVWSPRGRLQFIGEQARLAGRGALLEALEQLKTKLSQEGLFAIERKRPLPADPAVIGVVTSASGAAIHDIVKVAFRRGPVRILLAPTIVQGQGAAEGVVGAIDRLERLKRLDVIIVGRGGGSLDDLMVFNDEAVVRRVARCRVPVVSAVGHEVDVTLTDLAADARAATPSQAAEMIVPDSAVRERALAQLRTRLSRAMRARMHEDAATVATLRRSFAGMRRALAEHQQRLDERTLRLTQVTAQAIGHKRSEVERLHRRLSARHPRAVVARSRGALGPLSVRLAGAMRARASALRGASAQMAGRLDALSPLAVLARGYAIATTQEGRAIRSPAEVTRGDLVTVRAHRGAFRAAVLDVDTDIVRPAERHGHDEEPS